MPCVRYSDLLLLLHGTKQTRLGSKDRVGCSTRRANLYSKAVWTLRVHCCCGSQLRPEAYLPYATEDGGGCDSCLRSRVPKLVRPYRGSEAMSWEFDAASYMFGQATALSSPSHQASEPLTSSLGAPIDPAGSKCDMEVMVPYMRKKLAVSKEVK